MANAAKTIEDQRRRPRTSLKARGSARIALTVELLDISAIGVRAKLSFEVPVGTLLKIGLPGGEMRHARVVWSRDGVVGCEFLAPLSDGELAQLAG